MASTRKPIQQSAVLAYRVRKKGPQIALVTSLDTGRWVVPKGNVESGMTAWDSAAKEAYEEAGLEGEVTGELIGVYLYQKTELKGGGLCEVELFPMKVRRARASWPEKKWRRRKWMSLGAAADAVDEDDLAELIATFGKTLDA